MLYLNVIKCIQKNVCLYLMTKLNELVEPFLCAILTHPLALRLIFLNSLPTYSCYFRFYQKLHQSRVQKPK